MTKKKLIKKLEDAEKSGFVENFDRESFLNQLRKSTIDLFNPPPKLNYNIMIKDIDFNKFDNPYIQVIWEDYAENFTQEKIKSVRHYFQKKYNTTNVNVITKTKTVDVINQNVDVSFNILDKNYQYELVKSFLVNKNIINLTEDIFNLDKIVDNKLLLEDNELAPFKKWYIKNIEFSNFLSYGENQKIDFDKCNGISVVESTPSNFGGKTVLTVDLLLFLFFNETTKTTKAEEIFNRFTNKDKVFVKGEIIIDGDEYVIVRNIERKKKKDETWNVKTELDFFKKLSDGSLQNFTGEQRRETENFIKTSIGSKEDFLMTILTTATNLEELIDSKPTARGQVLSRFMGLDFLKKKEEIGKEIYSEFSKSMLSNIYSSEKLKTDNDGYEVKISELEKDNITQQDNLIDVQNRIIKGQEYRDGLLKSKHTDIDIEISKINPEQVESEIIGLKTQKQSVERQLKELKVVEPTEFYSEQEHDKLKDEHKVLYKKIVQLEQSIKSIENLKSSVDGGIKCEHCGIELMMASITQNKISELDGYVSQKNDTEKVMSDLINKESRYTQLKKEFDEYEKNKLIKEKYELTIEGFGMKIKGLKDKLDKFNLLQDKISTNNKIETQLIKANLRLDELNREKSSVQRIIDSNNYQINSLKDKIEQNNQMIVKIKEESEKERIYKLYLEIFGKNGISKQIMKTMIPMLNTELQRLLEDSCHFRLEININDKNEVEFLMIDNNTQVEKLMSSGSGYERTVASLALRAVLSKICSLPKPNIIVFDEVFGKISNENLEMVGEFFTKIKNYFEKIFVITHNPLVSNWADNVVKITKENNISSVKQ
jgi:DNA repair exonuclease SbcCD ATPase subunit